MWLTKRTRRVGRSTAAMTVLVFALFLTWGVAAATALPADGASDATSLGGERTRRASRADARLLNGSAAAASSPPTVTPVAQIEAMLSQVVSPTLYQYVGDLSGEWPVMVGGEAYTLTTRYTYSGEPVLRATQFVSEHLAALGLEMEYHDWLPDRPPNVIGELPGERHPERIVILSAHLDSYTTENPMEVAPGADDNASGVATVLLAADILSRYDWDCTLRFALWTGEEQWLLGSGSYAERAHTRGEEIIGVLNLDMMGWDGIEGPDIDLHAKAAVTGSVELAQLFDGVVAAYDLNLLPQIVPTGIAASDHASFWTYGYPAILGIEDYYPSYHDFNPFYHTGQDRLEYLDMEYFTEFAKAAIGTFAHMGCLLRHGPLDQQLFLPLVIRTG